MTAAAQPIDGGGGSSSGDGGSIRFLGPTSRAARPFPRYSLWLLGIALLRPLFSWFLPDAVTLVVLLTGIVGAIALGGWLEDEIYRRMDRRRLGVRLTGAALLPIVLLIALLLLIVPLALSSLPFGLDTSLAVFIGFAGLWSISASLGSLIIRVVDATVSALVHDFRSRILAAVMGLVGLAAGAFWLLLKAVAILVFKLERGEDLGIVSISSPGGESVTMPTTEFFADDPTGLAGALFFIGLILVVPAVVSVAGKLADSVMSRINPLGDAFAAVGEGDRGVRIEEGGSTEMKAMAEHFNRMVVDLDMAQRLERAFGVYVSPQVMARIKERHGDARIPPELRRATVLFLDIRGFTSMSERLPPGTVASVLNRYFERVVEVVDTHDGYLDKFIGDAVIVVWNGPVDQEDHEERAVRCAIALQEATGEMNEEGLFPESGSLGVGIGVATGQVFCGNVGGVGQMEYTVIGDTVNLAARLTGQAPAGEVWISPLTGEALPESIPGEPLTELHLKGKKKPIRPLLVWPRPAEALEGGQEEAG